MSRLSRDRIHIALCPGRLTGLRFGGMIRPRVLEKRSNECDPGYGPQPWHGALHALQGVSESLKSEAVDVTVIVSNHFVRFALVPWSDELRDTEDELAMARYCFTKIYGERANGWAVRLSEDAPGAARLASAVDKELVDAIVGCFKPGGRVRLVSIQPYLMAAFNTWRSKIAAGEAWFLLLEPGRACLALIRDGKWVAIRNTKADIADVQSLLDLLERERNVTETTSGSGNVLVYCAENPRIDLPRTNGWSFTNLVLPARAGFAPLSDERYAMALCG